MVPADSRWIARVPRYSGCRSPGRRLACKGLSPAAARLSRRFQFVSNTDPCGPTTPGMRRHNPGLGCSAFARHYLRNHSCFLFLRVLRCFSSPRSPPAKRDATLRVAGCPIRVPADQRPLAPPRGFSQLAAPFVACKSLGIHRAPLSTSSDARAFQPATCRHGVQARLHTSVVPFAWAFLLLAFLSSTSCLSQHVKDLAALVRAGVENDGFEPSTPCLQGRCSSQLS